MTWLASERAAHMEQFRWILAKGGVAVHAYADDKAATLERGEPEFAGLRAEVRALIGRPIQPIEPSNVGTQFRIPINYRRPAGGWEKKK